MAGQNIGNLKVTIGADTADLSRGIGRAKAMIGGLAKAAKVAGVAAAGAFTAASVGMVAMTREGLKSVDAQAKLARSVDGSIDGLRALQLAGSDAGASIEEINGAVQMMGKRLAEAAREGKGPAADALKLLGLNARELMNMDVDERMGAIADQINGMGLSAQDAAGIMREFGVRSNEVALVMLQGSDAIRRARGEVSKFGLSLSSDAAAGVESANDAMSRMGLVFEGMRQQLAVQMAPTLQMLAVNFQDAAAKGGPLSEAVSTLVAGFSELARALLNPEFVTAVTLFGTTLTGAIAGLARGIVTLADNAEIAGAAMVALGGAMAFFSGPIGLAIAAIASGAFLLSTAFKDSAEGADEANEAEKRLHETLGMLDTANAEAVASGEQLINTHIDEARSAIEAAKANVALARSRQQAGNALLDQNPLTADGNSGYAEAMAKNTAAAEAELAKAEAQLESYQKTLEGFKRSQFPSQGAGTPRPDPAGGDGGGTGDPAGVKRLNDDLAKLIATIDPAAAKLDKYREAMRLLTAAKQEGIITDDEYLMRADQIAKTFGEQAAQSGAAKAGVSALNKELAQSDDLKKAFATDISGAFGTLITSIDSGTDALRQFGLELVKIFAVQGISKILGGSDWFSGGLFKIGANALGTDNWRGGLSWVGERGPELVNLPRGAQVIPNNKLGGALGSGGMQFSYAPSIDARGASLQAVQELDQRMRADAAQFNAKVEHAIQKAKTGRKL